MATGSSNNFVFIDEDQRHKYSKSTLSAINAQVAKHAHRNRKHVVKPKPKSAPCSPSAVGDRSIKTSPALETQDDQLNKARRRSSEPRPSPSTVSIKRGSKDSALSPYRQASASPKQRQTSLPTEKELREVKSFEGNDDHRGEQDGAEPGELTDLFQKLCRITNNPTYQDFPFPLDLEERRLAHYWFTEVLKDDFGMKLQLETTFQGQLTRYPLAFQVPLRWIIAKAATTLHQKTGSQSLAVVYKSQEKALNRLQDILKDTSTPTDEAVGSILQSIVHNPEFRKMHLRGLDAIIDSRGGLEKVIRSSTVTCAEHILLVHTFAEYSILKLDELESLKTRFFSALQSMQRAAQEYSRMISEMEIWASSVDLADCCSTPASSDNLAKWSFTEQTRRIFSERTATGQLLRREFCFEDDLVRKSRLFSALFQLHSMLIQYTSIEHKSLFLRRLEEATKIIATNDPVSGYPTMMAGTHIYAIGFVSRQLQEELQLSDWDEKGVPTALDGIAAIKIYGLLLDSMRLKLHTCLVGWLLGSKDVKFFSQQDMSAMALTITQLWLQKMRSEHGQEGMDYFQT